MINIASIDGVSVNSQEPCSYAASKAGLIHPTRRMALRLVKVGIVVSAIAPGSCASNLNRLARDHGDELAHAIPAGRIGIEEDMAGAFIYLASREPTMGSVPPWWWTAAPRWRAFEGKT